MGRHVQLLSGRCSSSAWLMLMLLLLLVVVDLQPAICKHKSAKFNKERALPDDDDDETWDSVSQIPYLEALEFKAKTRFILDMCSNAYKYDYQEALHKQADPLSPIIGWHLSDKVSPLAPLSGGAAGLRALVYEEDSKPLDTGSPRAVLVFRGWQTTSTSSDELADLCAGKLLFPAYVDFLSPPFSLCSSFFTVSNLDYLSQAITYTRLVLTYYPSSSLLLSGHSFGAGLAVLVSAALQNELCKGPLSSLSSHEHHHHRVKDSCNITLPVVSFSGPGTDDYLRKRVWKLFNKEYVITISHEWDFFSVRAKWRGYRGWLCLYDVSEPPTCKECFSDELRTLSLEMLKSRASILHNTLKSKAKKKDDDDDDNDDDDDCPCEYDDEPCWDCLTDTHAPESLRLADDENSKTCEFFE